MKSSIAFEYENKKWYRVVKALYIGFFVLCLAFANLIIFSSEAGLWPFVITNAVVVFFFGTIEGLFWYIARGKWGYPKDIEYTDLEKTINNSFLTKSDLLNPEETAGWTTKDIKSILSINIPSNSKETEVENSYIFYAGGQELLVDVEDISSESHDDDVENKIKDEIDESFNKILSHALSTGVKRKNIILKANKIINDDFIWYRTSISHKKDSGASANTEEGKYDMCVTDYVGAKIDRKDLIFELSYYYNDGSDTKKIEKTINEITKSSKFRK